MKAALLLAALALGPQVADTSGAAGPFYTADSIANTASNVSGLYAPNTFVTIYGQNLAYVTKAISPDDISGGSLPTALIGTGVRVLINNIPADIYYVSPGQINLLVPTILTAGPAIIQSIVDGIAGPAVSITLNSAAPSFFQIDASTVVATHADYSLVTADSPAHAGEEIVLYATGLGPTVPAAIPNQIPKTAARIAATAGFQVLLNGVAVDPTRIAYAGVTPGYAGLFQINLRLPDDAPQNPEIRVGNANILSPPLRYLMVQ
jgi:uncharacterized protein (TIGR03437 family)